MVTPQDELSIPASNVEFMEPTTPTLRDPPSWKRPTRPCPFYSQGKCLFSDSCSFLHDVKIKVRRASDAVILEEPRIIGNPPLSRAGDTSPRSPARSPRMTSLLLALKDVIGEDQGGNDEDDDVEPAVEEDALEYQDVEHEEIPAAKSLLDIARPTEESLTVYSATASSSESNGCLPRREDSIDSGYGDGFQPQSPQQASPRISSQSRPHSLNLLASPFVGSPSVRVLYPNMARCSLYSPHSPFPSSLSEAALSPPRKERFSGCFPRRHSQDPNVLMSSSSITRNIENEDDAPSPTKEDSGNSSDSSLSSLDTLPPSPSDPEPEILTEENSPMDSGSPLIAAEQPWMNQATDEILPTPVDSEDSPLVPPTEAWKRSRASSDLTVMARNFEERSYSPTPEVEELADEAEIFPDEVHPAPSSEPLWSPPVPTQNFSRPSSIYSFHQLFSEGSASPALSSRSPLGSPFYVSSPKRASVSSASVASSSAVSLDAIKEEPPSTKVPFGFRNSKRRDVLRPTPPALDLTERPASSLSIRSLDVLEPPSAGALRPLRLSTILTSPVLGPSSERDLASESTPVPPSPSSSVLSDYSISNNRLLSSARSSVIIPEHVRNTLVLSNTLSPLLLGEDHTTQLSNFGSPSSVAFQSPITNTNPPWILTPQASSSSSSINYRPVSIERHRRTSRLSATIYPEEEDENEDEPDDDLYDQTIRYPAEEALEYGDSISTPGFVLPSAESLEGIEEDALESVAVPQVVLESARTPIISSTSSQSHLSPEIHTQPVPTPGYVQPFVEGVEEVFESTAVPQTVPEPAIISSAASRSYSLPVIYKEPTTIPESVLPAESLEGAEEDVLESGAVSQVVPAPTRNSINSSTALQSHSSPEIHAEPIFTPSFVQPFAEGVEEDALESVAVPQALLEPARNTVISSAALESRSSPEIHEEPIPAVDLAQPFAEALEGAKEEALESVAIPRSVPARDPFLGSTVSQSRSSQEIDTERVPTFVSIQPSTEPFEGVEEEAPESVVVPQALPEPAINTAISSAAALQSRSSPEIHTERVPAPVIVPPFVESLERVEEGTRERVVAPQAVPEPAVISSAAAQPRSLPAIHTELPRSRPVSRVTSIRRVPVPVVEEDEVPHSAPLSYPTSATSHSTLLYYPQDEAPHTAPIAFTRSPIHAIATPKPTLMFAIASDNVEEVEKVLSQGEAGPNDQVGPQSALEFALTSDQLLNKMEIVKTLLAYGADPSSLTRSNPASPEVGKDSFAEVLESKMDPATKYFVNRADAAHTRKTSALIHRSFFRPLTRMRYDVIGQDCAFEQLFRVLSMHSQNLSVAPVVVLLCGPSGHGKSLVARKFGSLLDVPTHTVNMTTLRSTHDLWQSYSMDPYEEPSELTLAEFLTENEGKRCVVVLDEIDKVVDEKALWSLLMPWELGRCSFEAGRRHVNVRNVIWLGTANIGHELVFEHQLERSDPEAPMSRQEYVGLVEMFRPDVSRCLGPSLLSRVTTVLPFIPFTTEEKMAIATQALYALGKEMAQSMSAKAVENLVSKALNGYLPPEGARSLYRAVSTQLLEALDSI